MTGHVGKEQKKGVYSFLFYFCCFIRSVDKLNFINLGFVLSV